MTTVLLCYLAALVVLVGGFFGIRAFFKSTLRAKFKAGSFFGGMVLSVGIFLGMLLLFRICFSNNMYYNTKLYRTVVGFALLLLLSFVRFMIIKLPFFDRDRKNAGYSFAAGFGAAPAAFLGIYSLLMLLIVGGNGIFNGPCIAEENGLLSFADNTMISVFRPEAGHISFAILFIVYAFYSLLFADLIRKISDHVCRMGVGVWWLVFLMILDGIMILPVPFIGMYGISHWGLSVIGIICTAAAGLLMWKMPVKEEKKEYIRQFE